MRVAKKKYRSRNWFWNDAKLIRNEHDLGSIWYHSDPSDVPYSPNQFLSLDFFCRFLQQEKTGKIKKTFVYFSQYLNFI